MGKAAPSVAADKLELYEKLVATNPSVERKGSTMPYTSCKIRPVLGTAEKQFIWKTSRNSVRSTLDALMT